MDARGKSLSLAHVIHYCYSAGWFILPVPRGKIGGFITKISCNSKFQTIGGLFKDYVNEETSGFKKEKVEADYQ